MSKQPQNCVFGIEPGFQPWIVKRSRFLGRCPGVAPGWIEAAPLALADGTKQIPLAGDSFGCADLVQNSRGEWLILEVGTDGFFNHVDRELGDAAFELELSQRIASAFWNWVDKSCGEASSKG